MLIIFTPQPLMAVALFSPMVSGWVCRQASHGKKCCPGCIPETIRSRKLILGRDIGWGGPCRSDLEFENLVWAVSHKP